jgi:hypothetical protein
MKRLAAMMWIAAATSVTSAHAEGDRATKDDYALDVQKTTAKLKAGTDGVFDIVIIPKNGKKIHGDAPLEVKLGKSAQVKPDKEKLGRGDVVDAKAKDVELRTVLHAQAAGTSTLSVDVSFFLCVDAWCQRMSDKVEIPITVE